MKVDILLNSKAHSGSSSSLEEKLKRALFRVQPTFLRPKNKQEVQSLVHERSLSGTECFVLVGGDGTLNLAIRPLMELYKNSSNSNPIPSVCVIPAGTANDLANEMKITKKIERAARAILEGEIQKIDVLEISAPGRNAFMLTNGGIGIPAQAAETANKIRRWLDSGAKNENRFKQKAFQISQKATKWAGSKIYDFSAVKEILSWNNERWNLEVKLSDGTVLETSAPMILVNNQPNLGRNFQIAPHTKNTDGKFNVVFLLSQKPLKQMRTILKIKSGKISKVEEAMSFETSELTLKCIGDSKPLTFFGDGEILLRESRETTVRCLPRALSLITLCASSE